MCVFQAYQSVIIFFVLQNYLDQNFPRYCVLMSSEEKQSDISKTAAKRKYLLTDLDLEEVPFKMKPNPLNKNYGNVFDENVAKLIKNHIILNISYLMS